MAILGFIKHCSTAFEIEIEIVLRLYHFTLVFILLTLSHQYGQNSTTVLTEVVQKATVITTGKIFIVNTETPLLTI